MSNNARGGASARVTPFESRGRRRPSSKGGDDRPPSAPAPTTDSVVSGRFPATIIADQHLHSPRRPRASVWLLIGWLVVSTATIAAAAGVIARYF